MSFNIQGYVVLPARFATGNAQTTGEATSGVSRDHLDLSVLGTYVLAPGNHPVEPYADMYRAAVAQRPVERQAPDQYLIWAATTGSLSTLENDSFILEGEPTDATSSKGVLSVTTLTPPGVDLTDGTLTFYVRDGGGRDLGYVTSLTLKRGDTGVKVVVLRGAVSPFPGFDTTANDPSTGKTVLNDDTAALLGGGFSKERGDSITAVSYVLSSPKFWWSRNDAALTRFGWDGAKSTWAPLKGSTPVGLGPADPEEESYTLSPPPSRYSVGESLPGLPAAPESYALIRSGVYPDATSVPLYVKVVPDAATETTVDWAALGSPDAVVGLTNGVLILNPAWLTVNAGRPLWYNPEGFPEDSEGAVGVLVTLQTDSNYNHPVLSPVPGPTDRPMVRIGSRRHLTAIAVEADADLPLPTDGLLAGGGTFYWSIATGKTSFSADDIAKATPGAVGYEITYLGSILYYDGVSMSTQPCPLQVPLPAVIDDGGVGVPSSGDVFIQRAVAMPPPGTSGVLWVPDGSGDLPDLTSGSPETRPNGTGLKREVSGIGDSFFFSSGYAFEDLKVVEYDDDLPKLKIRVKRNEVAVSRLPISGSPAEASRAQLRRRQVRGEALYFTQANLTPSVYSESARIFSRYVEKFVLSTLKTEVFRFAIDGSPYTWLASALAAPANGESYTASEIADSLNTVIDAGAGTGSATALRGRVVLQAGVAPDYTGIVEIGWNSDWEDLSGNAALGFLPGWRVDTTDTTYRWQPDSGLAFGVFRSPDNLDRSNSAPDVRATGSLGFKRDSGRVLLTLDGQSALSILSPPLVDLPGFDDGVHFKTFSGLKEIELTNYGLYRGFGAKYDWPNQLLRWTSLGTTRNTPILGPTGDLQLNDVSVFPETLSSAAMAPTDTGFGAYLKRVGALVFQELTLGSDFLAIGEGGPGIVSLIEKEGPKAYDGGSGEGTLSGTFSNPVFSSEGTLNQVLQNEMYAAIEVGYLLQILNGESAGIYVITDVTQDSPGLSATKITLSPPPAFAETGLSWRVFEAQLVDDYDAALIADIQLTEFNHFSEEPWNIRVLTPLGAVGTKLEKAWVEEALASGRACQIRFGVTQPPSDSSATVTFLETDDIGTIEAEGRVVPDLLDPHFTESVPGDAYFQLRVGSNSYTTGDDLAIVTAFTGSATLVEVGQAGEAIAGEIRFGSDVVSALGGETVYYGQLFRAPAALPAGQAEVDPSSGEVNLSREDLSDNAEKEAYFLENYVVAGNLDASVSPLNGAFLLGKPLRAFQIVESQYFQADSNGDKKLDEETGELIELIEYLPMIVRLETCTRVDAKTYKFNPTGRTLTALGSEAIWVGVNLQNYAGVITAVVNADSTISFASDVVETDQVQINYAVLEAFGSEQPFSTSTSPVYRKPFFLEADQTTFDLTSDRTSDLVVGQLLSIGPALFYLKSVAYDAATDLTSVVIWPPVPFEVGSRAPSKGAGMATSNLPVAIIVDPVDPVSGGGAEGFWADVDQALTPMLPVSRGNSQISFVGDLTDFTKFGHILEVAGVPYLVVSANLSDDGRYTVTSLSTPTQSAHTDADTVRVSVRKAYTPPSPFEFSGIKPTQEGQEYLLFLMGRRDYNANPIPGKQLTEGVHFEVDPLTGDILLKKLNQAALQPWETLQASYVASDIVGPVLEDGAVVAPSYRAQYLHAGEPSEQNGFLGSTLAARFTFASADAFFAEIAPMSEYLAVVAASSASKGQATSRSSGPPSAFPGETNPSTQGGLGLRGEVHDLQNQDSAARTYVEFYNGVILAFEQVLEAIDGRIIGDRDGKFRFFIGHGKRYAPPGYEDGITRELVIRLIWREIINTWSPAIVLGDGWFVESDPVFSPPTGFTVDSTGPPSPRPGETDGLTPDPFALKFFTERQRRRVKNDMDDKLLVGLGRFRGFAALFPSFDVPGLFKQMWQDSDFSRLYPERSKHFSRLLPGLEAVEGSNPGYYSMGRIIPTFGPEPGEVSAQLARTWQSPIGAVSNPALGKINRTVSVSVSDRHPRARIWYYFPQGSEELDTAANAVTGGSLATVGIATLVATPLPLSEFPINPETGFPDFSKLLSSSISSGELSSLESGDADLSTPAFEAGQRVSFGKPDGSTYTLTDSNGFPLFVEQVSAGCILTLRDVFDATVSGPDVFANGDAPLEDLVSGGTGRGDTVFIQSLLPNPDDMPGDSDKLTPEVLSAAAAAQGGYSTQFDLRVARRSGEFRDNSLLTGEDIFHLPLQKMLGQNPPSPLSCVEGAVELVNTDKKPLKLPCLLGQAADDSGDVSIPYMRSLNEIQVLGEIADSIGELLGADTSYAGLPYPPAPWPDNEKQDWDAVYPDEIILNDGSIYPVYDGSTRDPATLYTGQDLRPVNTNGSYTPRSAIGDARPFDFLLVEVGQPAFAGHVTSTGILSIGAVSGFTAPNTAPSTVETPRFVTPFGPGFLNKYTLHSAFGYTGAGAMPALSGVLPVEVAGAGPPAWVLTLGFTSVPDVIFSNQSGDLTGGLLALIPGGAAPNNAVVIRFYNPDPLAATSFLGAIVLISTVIGDAAYCWDAAGAGTSTPVMLQANGVYLDGLGDVIKIEADTELLPLCGVTSGTFYDFTIDIDTFISTSTWRFSGGALTIGQGLGSGTCGVSRDRLTFNEAVSLQKTLPRGTVAAGAAAEDISTRLDKIRVTRDNVDYWDVNDPLHTNGGDPFTFLERVVGSVQPYVGTFTPSSTVGDEKGTLKVMAWEGHLNTPLDAALLDEITASAVASSDVNETEVIFNGTGRIWDDVPNPGGGAPVTLPWSLGTPTLDGTKNWVEGIAVGDGAYANVEPGDAVVVGADGNEVPWVKTGTYLVRHAVDTNATSVGVVEILGFSDIVSGTPCLSTVAGSRDFLDLSFPAVKSYDPNTGILVLSNVIGVPSSPTGCGFPTSTGHVYLILEAQYADYDSGTGQYTARYNAVYRADYPVAPSYDSATKEVTLGISIGSWVDCADGNTIDDDAWIAAASVGTLASGMTYLPVSPRSSIFPENNLVGYWENDAGNACIGGVQNFTLGNTYAPNHNSTTPAVVVGASWDAGAAEIERLLTTASPSGADNLGVRIPEGQANTEFYEERRTVVYGREYDSTGLDTDSIGGVPTYLDVSELTGATSWDNIHFEAGLSPANQVFNCLLPGDLAVFGDSLDPSDAAAQAGFWALSGVFLEPSIPLPVQNLTQIAAPRVVSRSNALSTSDSVGIRQANDYIVAPATTTGEEGLSFFVRRIRRFHDIQTKISNAVAELRPLYEMRRGTVGSGSGTTFTASAFNFPSDAAPDFSDPISNVNAGDILRIINPVDMAVTDVAEIQGVTSSTELELARPGLTEVLPANALFEIYLEQAIVPQEQSNQQLFDLLTSEVVFERFVDYQAPDIEGGKVTSFNLLEDDLVTALSGGWSAEGVAVGDYVVIDPLGTLYDPEEKGTRPLGDERVPTRAGYDEDSPSDLDDNRGFYKVIAVDENLDGDPAVGTLLVDGTSRFSSGDETPAEDVIFGVDDGTNSEYALLPTINDSNLTGGKEGQQALRPTAPPVAGVYADRTGFALHKSIEPFGYKIIRPNTVFSKDATELILFLRERTLSWIEEVKDVYENPRGGDYYVFQDEDHIEDLGSSTDPTDGEGLIPNIVIESLEGLVGVQPYANTSDCLSILGRRFFILDGRLDSLPMSASPAYTSFTENLWEQRPVLPDLIDEVLDLSDRFRNQRYSWISFRADRVDGSIMAARRAEDQLPGELEKQRELIAQKKSLDES